MSIHGWLNWQIQVQRTDDTESALQHTFFFLHVFMLFPVFMHVSMFACMCMYTCKEERASVYTHGGHNSTLGAFILWLFFFFFETWSLIPWNTVWNIFVTLYHSHNYKSLSAPIENGVVSAHTAVGTLFEPSNFVHIATVTQHPQERRVWRRAVKMKLKPSQLGCQPIKQRATVTQTLTKGNKKCKFAVFTGIVEKTRKKSSSDSFL